MKAKLYTPLVALTVLGLCSCGDLGSLASTAIGVAAAGYSAAQEYDANGVPIYGYDGNNAVYGYDSNNQPIYDIALLATAASVPNWESKAGASVIYPTQARRAATPPPQARHHAPLKHRHPVVAHGYHRPNRAATPPPLNPHVSGLGSRPDRAAPLPPSSTRTSEPAPRPDRATPPSRNPRVSGHGPHSNSDHRMQPGQNLGRPGFGPQQGRPNAGPRPGRQKGKPATSTPTAPAGVEVAPVPTATAKPASSGGYVCMSCSLGDTLIKKCTNKKCVNYGNPPSSYKKR